MVKAKKKAYTQRQLGNRAYLALLRQDAKAIEKLIGLGLDINDIDLSGIANRNLVYACDLYNGKEISALRILFCSATGEQPSIKRLQDELDPSFVRELGKLGADFNQRFIIQEEDEAGNRAAITETPLRLLYINFILAGPLEADKIKKRKAAEILKIFLDFGGKADKLYTPERFNEYTFASTSYISQIDRQIEMDIFEGLYKLELAAGWNVYADDEREKNPQWVKIYSRFYPKDNIPIPSIDNNGNLQINERIYTSDEDKDIFRQFITNEAFTKLPAGLFINDSFVKSVCEITSGKTDIMSPNGYFSIMREILKVYRGRQSSYKNISTAEEICRIDQSINHFSSQEELNLLTTMQIILLDDFLVNDPDKKIISGLTLPERRKPRYIYYYNNVSHLRLPIATPIFYSPTIIAKLCEASLKAEISLEKIFMPMIRDLIFMAAYRTGNTSKSVNDKLALFEKKIDLLQSYGWDINAADDAGNEPLHYIFQDGTAYWEHICDKHNFTDSLKQLLSQMFNILSEKGADFSKKNKAGRTVADMLVDVNGSGRPFYECRSLYRLLKVFETMDISKAKNKDAESSSVWGCEMSW